MKVHIGIDIREDEPFLRESQLRGALREACGLAFEGAGTDAEVWHRPIFDDYDMNTLVGHVTVTKERTP